ncbi:hypothetical protein [Acinetobacter baumannii]|uniref:Uncharacterized protein n=2 Tax=Acinetobacter baumannii TaxID=470 RepID=A0A7D6ZNA9_ACIBA|nr:hypothetical protein [Acinetobacter baumannii]EXB41298.1 hypothetical protein J540_3595 [Acinetobacter baumannii 1440422]EHU2404992.1 hypothetical protein [Acinetobacter baumannii]EHU3342184.1 hypothetical protein [Acinetobacter baumannii]MBV6563165.1 hypothetical protein [Acinetobacter baumannii]MBV6588573.1 hypothetical protein [Acinetobacter baumannii]
MTDLNKEREAFERLPLAELAIKSEFVYYNEETNSYWPNEDFCPSDAPETMNFAWEAWQEKAKAQAVPEKKIYLTCEQLYAAANFGAPNKDPELLETELTIAWFDEAHSGSGYYVYISEYPEEGAMKLESESGAEG